MPRFITQLRQHRVALISLAVAVLSLGYNTWRNETTEEQRNVRHASFRVLETLGELQEVVDRRYYYLPFETVQGQEAESRLRGYGGVAMARDLMRLMPPPAPSAGLALHGAWVEHFSALDDLDEAGNHTAQATAAERTLTQTIERARTAVVEVLEKLD